MLQHEEERLDALYQLNLLDTPPSESFDRITRMAAQLFNLPIAAVSLTDRDRQWFKSRVGVQHDTIPRVKAPCAEVAEDGRVLVIPNLLEDRDYASSLLADSGIRFYAGVPLMTREGYGLGSLCVLGTAPRKASDAEMAGLVDLANIVMSQIEMEHAFGRIDPISGLPNKTQFLEDMNDLGKEHAGERRYAVLLDLARSDQLENGMRVVGATFSDTLVRNAARALRSQLGNRHQAYQVAATQFVFLSPKDQDQDTYFQLLERELAAIQAAASAEFMVNMVFGVTPIILGETDSGDILRIAYAAAQDARATGTHLGLYSLTNDMAHARRFELLAEFRTALQDPDQLNLVFQPRISLRTGQCLGAEALLRWTHSRLGSVSPAEFIPVVEHTSLAQPTTAWVLDAAMQQVSTWRKEWPEFQISINVSAANLEEPDFAERVQLTMAKYLLSPHAVELEITESAVMDKNGRAMAHLHDLNQAGVKLAIDDFGTGYSSLAYLQRLPVHVVKIDRSFIRNLGEHKRNQTLVRSMISLTHDLGFSVVAEGVETAADARILEDLGCEEGQGYFFARPLRTTAFMDWMTLHSANTSAIGRPWMSESSWADGLLLTMPPALATSRISS